MTRRQLFGSIIAVPVLLQEAGVRLTKDEVESIRHRLVLQDLTPGTDVAGFVLAFPFSSLRVTRVLRQPLREKLVMNIEVLRWDGEENSQYPYCVIERISCMVTKADQVWEPVTAEFQLDEKIREGDVLNASILRSGGEKDPNGIVTFEISYGV